MARAGQGGFTLVELIVVMVLLLVIASLVTPRMSSFFHGRALNHEARRMLSLINYAQSRATAEGVPVVFWVDPASSTYGIEIQAGYIDVDERAVDYTAEPSLSFEMPSTQDVPESELGDETLGLPENMGVIRFTPDGFIDEVSLPKVVIRQGQDGGALEIGRTLNRLRYEIRPVTNDY